MAGLSLFLLLGVGLVTWTVVAPDDAPYRAAPPGAAPASVQPGAAAEALERLERAVRRDDPDAAADLAAPDDASGRALLGALVDNAALIRMSEVSLRYVDESSGLDADGSWTAAVAVTWRYTGFDDAAARTEVTVRFRVDGDAVVVAGIGTDTLRTPVWMSGPVEVRRTPQTLVVVAAQNLPISRYDALATRAVPVVARVLPAWTPRLVVEVPADQTALERALDVDAGGYAQIAAVTGSADGTTTPESPVHVYVNPDVFDALGPRGQEVVLDHEAAHVAGDGPTSRAPTWLVEGFADYVALRDTDLPLSRTAAQVAAQVRRSGAPAELPGPADFDTLRPHLGAVYESAWLICVTLAERGGEAALTRFYTSVSAGESVAAGLRAGFDWSESDLVAAWRARLTALADAP